MSVEELAAAVERVLAARPMSALREAAECLGEAQAVLAEVAHGSSAPELLAAIDGFGHASAELAQAEQCCGRVEVVLRAYLTGLGVAAPGSAGTARVDSAESIRATGEASGPDQALIAEVRRQGHKISPERVVRIARVRDGRVVWLEEGDDRSGLRHIMEPKKVREFDRTGIPRNRIIDLVFDALVNGSPVGFMGVDRPVYEVETEGRVRRIAITISDNGYIVGANPISMGKKIRKHRDRD